MRAIKLHKVLRDPRPAPVAENVVSLETDTDDVGENVTQFPAPAADEGKYCDVVVNVETIRCFNPRREEKAPGTRITFIDGGGFAVRETFDEVCQALNRAGLASITAAEGMVGVAN